MDRHFGYFAQASKWWTTSSQQIALQWRHNGRDDVSIHQPHHCLLNRLFRRRSKKTSEIRVTGLCAGNSPVTSEFPAQMASNAENVSIWWRHHVFGELCICNKRVRSIVHQRCYHSILSFLTGEDMSQRHKNSVIMIRIMWNPTHQKPDFKTHWMILAPDKGEYPLTSVLMY